MHHLPHVYLLHWLYVPMWIRLFKGGLNTAQPKTFTGGQKDRMSDEQTKLEITKEDKLKQHSHVILDEKMFDIRVEY